MNTDERGHVTDVGPRHRHHAPTEAQVAAMNAIRTHVQALEDAIKANTIRSRGQSLALTHLEEVRMWANQTVIIGEETNLR